MTLTDHDKAQIEKIKPNTKIRILSEEHSKYVQEMAFGAGYKWPISGRNIRYTDEDQLNFHKYNDIYWGDEIENLEEIFIDLTPKESKIAESHKVKKEIKPPFKFRNANLPVVRQWLKDNGYLFANDRLDILSWNIDAEFGYVNQSGSFSTSYIIKDEGSDAYDSSVDFFYSFNYPEIEFDFVIRDISIDNTVEIAKLESELEILRVKADKVRAKLGELKS